MTATTVPHTITVTVTDGRFRRDCTCGFQSATFVGDLDRRDLKAPCPRDDTITALTTLQFASGGLLDSRPVDGYAIHLVRTRAGGGTPGPTLCGIDRFAEGSAGWSVGGGVSGPGIDSKPCPGCVEVAGTEFPHVPVAGSVGGRAMAAALGVEVVRR